MMNLDVTGKFSFRLARGVTVLAGWWMSFGNVRLELVVGWEGVGWHRKIRRSGSCGHRVVWRNGDGTVGGRCSGANATDVPLAAVSFCNMTLQLPLCVVTLCASLASKRINVWARVRLAVFMFRRNVSLQGRLLAEDLAAASISGACEVLLFLMTYQVIS
jgi:hypothetical protein